MGGIPELIQDGVNGLLFESKNIHALSEAMLKLVSSPDLIKSLGEHALAFARAELTADQKMLQLLASYRRTIASNP